MQVKTSSRNESHERSDMASQATPASYHVWQDDRSGDVWIVAATADHANKDATSPLVSFALLPDEPHRSSPYPSMTLHVSLSLLGGGKQATEVERAASRGAINDTVVIELARAVVTASVMNNVSVYTKHCLFEMLLTQLLTDTENEDAQGRPRGLSFEQWQRRELENALSPVDGSSASLQVLARRCRLSVCHFSRVFKATYGLSLHRYAVKRRIDHGCSLLTETRKPISEVALDCGFADQSSFTRRFSAVKGVSPATWRKRAVIPSLVESSSVKAFPHSGAAAGYAWMARGQS